MAILQYCVLCCQTFLRPLKYCHTIAGPYSNFRSRNLRLTFQQLKSTQFYSTRQIYDNTIILKRNSHISTKKFLTIELTKPRLVHKIYNQRYFHQSRPQNALPLLQWFIVKPLAKISAVFLGRAVRKSWKDLPDGRKAILWGDVKRYRWQLAALFLGFGGFCLSFYYTHLQKAPYSGRVRFIAFDDYQMKSLVQNEYENFLNTYDGKFLPESHPLYKVTLRIAQRIIRTNSDFKQIAVKDWKIHVVHKDIANAFVLPNGHIFVFTGLFKTCENEEQLGIVLAHEMAHVVMNHSAELVSYVEFVDFFLIILLGAIWTLLPNDGLAIVASWFKNKVTQVMVERPHNRTLETEADDLGLILAAKACFDVRESQAFWINMAKDDTGDIEWLSTHPSSQNRAAHLSERLPQAITLRSMCNCPKLPARDPVAELRKRIQSSEVSPG